MTESKAIVNVDTYRFYRYERLIDDLLENDDVMEMRHFTQHSNVTRFEHSLHVSYYSYLVCRVLRLDYKSAARGGLLHDLFLYDWHTTKSEDGMHAFNHPKVALRNAMQNFELNAVEKDIIKKHMWPVTMRPPRYMESFIVSCVDKFCALKEILMLNY